MKRKGLSIVLAAALLVQMLPLPMGCLAWAWDAIGISQSASAAGETTGKAGQNITWNYDANTKALSFAGSGAMDGYTYNSYTGRTNAPWDQYRDQIASITIGGGITSIGNYAFNMCTKVTSISLPSSVTGIGSDAFESCTGLTSVSMPGVTSIGSYAFYYCTGLSSVSMPSLKSMDSYVFYYCSELASVTIPNGVTSISSNAFYGCSSLSSVSLPASLTSIGQSAFNGCSKLKGITIPNQVKTIQKSAFERSGLEEISFPDSVTSMGESVLSYTKLKNVVWPKNVTSISTKAFQGCSLLEDIAIPDWVTSVGNSAFDFCSGAGKITGLDHVTSIGTSAFSSCNSLAKAVWSPKVNAISASAFANCTALTEIDIPGNVTSIGQSAFSGCTALESVTVPGTVNSIGTSAFQKCLKLNAVSISEGVATIGASAFYNCEALKTLSLPQSSLKTISGGAFSDTGLTSFTVPASVTEIGTNPWVGGSLQKISVASGNQKYAVDNDMLVELKDGVSYGVISYPCCGNVNATVPVTVKVIYNGAFQRGSLQGVTLPEGLLTMEAYAFNKSALQSVKLPKSLQEIGISAFEEAKALQSVEFSEGLVKIGDQAFYQATALQKVEFPGSLKEIGNSAFSRDTALITVDAQGGKLETIGISAFQDCTKLQNVLLGGELRTIMDSAFSGCKAIQKFALPDKVNTIGKEVFVGCIKLEAIDFPNSITKIGSGVLKGCIVLKKATFGSEIQEISGDVFENCPMINEITVSAKNTHMMAEGNVIYSKDKTKLIYYAAGLPEEKFSAPDGVEAIGAKAFTYCNHLQEIRFPDSVTSLAECAVYYNTSVNKIFFFGNAPQAKEITSYAGSPNGVTTYNVENYSIYQNMVKNYAYNNSGLMVFALPGTTGWEKGWTGIANYQDSANKKYQWKKTFDFDDKSWDPTKTDVSEGDFGSLTWKYRDDIGELSFFGKGKIPDREEDNLLTWTDGDDLVQDHRPDIKFIQTIDAEEIEIGKNAFLNAEKLVRILAGDHLTRIGEGAFANCTSLVHVDIRCAERIEKEAFMGDTAIVDDLDARNAKILGDGAFKGCSAMTEILLGEHLESIGAEGFSACGALESMVIPESVASIGRGCFQGCGTLRTINIPKGIKEVPAESFADCASLQKVYFYGDYPSAWAKDSFANSNGDLTLYYRAGNGTWTNAGSDWEGIPLVALDKFYTEKQDNYSFANTGSSFGYGNIYYIPLQRYVTALQSVVRGSFYYAWNSEWKGSCFGMASSSTEFYEGDWFDVKDYASSAEQVYDIPAPKNFDADLTKVVEIYQVSQYADEIGVDLAENYGQYRTLLKQVEEFERSGGLDVDETADPLVMCLYSNYCGHAVVPVAMNMDGEGNYILDVYDCNHPNAFQKLKIKKDFSGIEYEKYKQASFVKYSTVREALEKADFTGKHIERQEEESKKVSLAVNKENISLENGGGRDYTEIKGAYEQKPVSDGTEEETFGGIRSFVLPQGDYRMKAEPKEGKAGEEAAQEDLKYYVSTEEMFSQVETSDEDARLTVESYKGEGNDVLKLTSDDGDTESELSVMDVYGVEKEISLKGSSVSIEMTSDTDMKVTVSEDAKEVKVDGKPLAVEDNQAKVSFLASEGENPMEASDMRCDVTLDDKNRLTGMAETYLTWSKKAGDDVDIITKLKDGEGNVVAEYEKTGNVKFGKQKVNIDFKKVKTNMEGLNGEIGVTCEIKIVDSDGNVVRISQENLVLKKAQEEKPSPAPTEKPTSEPTKEPVVTPTPNPVVTPTPGVSQKPNVTQAPVATDKPNTEILGETKKPKETEKPKAKKSKAALPKKGKVIAAGSLKYIVTKSAKKNGKVSVYGARKKKASKIVIPNKVKLKGYSFKVTGIHKNAFKNMKRLTDVTIGGNVTAIGNNAFQNCKKMQFVVIPKRVTKIGGKAFAGCRSLRLMLVRSDRLKSLGGKAFAGVTSKMKVKTSKKRWRKYARMFTGKGKMSSGALFVINPVKLKYKGKIY